MAFGHAVERRGFSGDDDKIKGQKGDVDETLDGGVGDDVIIAFDGEDQVVGGDGEDDLSGGGGDDLLVGAIWEDTNGTTGEVDAGDTFTQDEFSDDFNAEATFEENGTDEIWLYDADDGGNNDDTGGTEDDGIYDVIDFSDTIDFVDPSDDDTPITTEEKEAQLDANLSYDTSTGELSYQGDVFFEVYEDAGTTAAGTVYVEVDGDQFVYDTANNDWDLVA